MKRKKMSLANITERLSRAEMKQILAGDREDGAIHCATTWNFCDNGGCTFSDGTIGKCSTNTAGTKCFCVGAF